MTAKLFPGGADDIIEAYLAGESEKALADRFHVSRTPIRRILLEGGIERRGPKEANRLASDSIPIEEHRRRMLKPQAAIRGTKRPMSTLLKRAATRQARQLHVSPAETLLRGWLTERSLDTVVQQAIGPYNVDLAAYPVAVEVLGGAWHAQKAIHERRVAYLFDAGWHLIFVWTHSTRSPLVESVADQLVTLCDAASGDPSTPRQYWVIRGDGQILSSGRADDGNFTLVVPGYQSLNART